MLMPLDNATAAVSLAGVSSGLGSFKNIDCRIEVIASRFRQDRGRHWWRDDERRDSSGNMV